MAMSEEKKKQLLRIAPWVALPVVALVAFGVGAWLYGPGESDADHEQHQHAAEDGAIWTCAMHPQIRLGEPGQCPICGMDLIPVQSEDKDAEAGPERITLSERARVNARIRTATVQRRGAGKVERRLLGRVDYDENTLRTVTSWIGGRIDRLHVRVTGERVKRGQVIASLYSPEVYSAHQDLIQARQQRERLGSATASAQEAAEAALQAGRDRLRLLGVPEPELKRMEKAQRPSEQVLIRTPFAGTVIERLATEGNYVSTGTGLYRVANLSSLWVQLDAYESDLSILKVGQDVSLKVEALPGEEFQGRVTFVDPVLNARTRTARVRIEVRNRDRRLSPGMFAEAIVQSASVEAGEQPLVIPDTAPLFTGRRSVVYVEVPGVKTPTYDARVVRLGSKMGDEYPVLGGLAEGDRVVVNGAFAIDADLQIRGGLAMMTAPDDTEAGPYDQIVQVSDKNQQQLAKIFKHYLELHAALTVDNLEDAKGAAKALAAAVDAVKPEAGSPFHHAWMPVSRQVSAHAMHFGHATSLDEARPVFRDLSQQAATMLRVFGNPTDDTLRLAFCPMALGGDGAEWIQRSEHIENPYFGAQMHDCGEVHQHIAHGTYMPTKQDAAARTPAPAAGHQH